VARNETVDIENFIRHCELRLKNKVHPKKSAGQLQLFPASKPFAITHLDIYGPRTETLSGNKYVLVIIDRFTRWLELIAMLDMLAETVANMFFNKIICRFSCPEKLITDRGSQVTSKLMRRLCERLGIRNLYTTAYHPRQTVGSNALCDFWVPHFEFFLT
jgi:transposase InsO family protein